MQISLRAMHESKATPGNSDQHKCFILHQLVQSIPEYSNEVKHKLLAFLEHLL